MNRTMSNWGPVALYAGVIFYMSSLPYLTPPPLGGLRLEQIDPEKLIFHLVEYSILGFLLLRAFVNSSSSFYAERALAMAAFLGFLYGVSDEFHQYFVPNRTPSFFDALADGVGAFIGAYFRRDLWSNLRNLR